MTFPSKSSSFLEPLPSLVEAIELAKGRTGPPTEDDRPRPRHRKPRILPGQLDIAGNETASTEPYSSKRKQADQRKQADRRKQLEKERLRLLQLGADPAWLERIFPRG
jgi:hypothetical protein